MAGENEVIPLARSSDETQRVEYLLQLALRSTSISDLKVWKVDNPRTSVNFERRCTSLLCLESWVDVATLPATNRVQDVCARGFHTPEDGSGLSFSTGSLHFRTPPGDGGLRQVLLCKVGVGRSYVLDEEAPRDLPDGYDSFYVHNPDANQTVDSYQHEYRITDAAQALPQYVVHFKWDGVSIPPSAVRDDASRKASFRQQLGSIRDTVIAQLSMLGPAAGDATSQLLQDISEKYEKALGASVQSDPVLVERSRAIDDTLGVITRKVQKIQENHKAVESAIYAKMEEVLKQLNEATESKISVLLAEELELRRQKQQIDWTESFVGVLADTLPPMSFIQSWDKHQGMRAALYDQSTGTTGVKAATAALSGVQPDLRLVGHLEVMTDVEAEAAVAPAPAPAPPPSLGASRFTEAPELAAFRAPVDASIPVPPAFPPPAAVHAGAGVPRASLETKTADDEIASARADFAALSTLTATLPVTHKALGESMIRQAAQRVAVAEAKAAAATHTPAQFSVAPPAPVAAAHHVPVPAPAPVSPPVPVAHSGAAAGRRMESLLQRYSLSNAAATRRRRLTDQGVSLPHDRMFVDSRALRSAQDATNLYLTLPFEQGYDYGAPILPSARLICTPTSDHQPSVASIQAALGQFEMDYGPPKATVILVRSGDFVFGGYAPDQWMFNGDYHGSPKAFLFSISRDCKVPYTGRARGPAQDSDVDARMAHSQRQLEAEQQYLETRQAIMSDLSMQGVQFDDVGNVLDNPAGIDTSALDAPPPRKREWVRHDAQRSAPDTLQFGVGDLVLSGDFSECQTSMERSYGIGLKPGSAEADTFLAGGRTFKADVVEVWAITGDAGGQFGGGGAYGGSAPGQSFYGGGEAGGESGMYEGGGDVGYGAIEEGSEY